jgi:hypothetical protein
LIEALIALIPALTGLLKDARTKRRLMDERGQRAIEAILSAVNETRLYINFLSRSNTRDPDREQELSRLWTRAGAALRGIDNELARRALLKGEYWIDPDQWDDERVRETRIGLEEVMRDANALLNSNDAR